MNIRFERGRFRGLRNRVSLVLPFLLVVSSWAQQEPAQEVPAFRVESNLILVDLIATDKDGNFIHDLRREEIEIYEDRKKQRAVFFELHGSESLPGEAESESVLASGPANTAHQVPVSSGSAPVVFLIDLNNMGEHTLNRIRESIRAYMEGDPERRGKFMLATVLHGLKIVHRFTEDSSSFLAAVDDLRSRPDTSTDFARMLQELETRFRPLDFPGTSVALINSVVQSVTSTSKTYLARIAMKLSSTRQAMVALFQHLGSLPGRKTIFYYSNGYPLNAGMVIQDALIRRLESTDLPQTQLFDLIASSVGGMSRRMEIAEHLRVMSDEANLAQISVYSIDPRGLLTTATDVSLAGGLANFHGQYAHIGISEPQRFLRILSEDTGGLTFANSNDLEAGLRRALRDSARYYMLGYEPTTRRKKGRFHEIKIKVRRRGVKVRFRRGYSESDATRNVRDQMVNAFKFPELFNDFPLRVGTGYRSGRLIIRTVIPTPALDFQTTDENRNQCTLEIVGALLDESGKWISEKFAIQKQFQLDFSDQELQDWKRHRVVVGISETQVTPGTYDLVVVARQNQTGRISASFQHVRAGLTFKTAEN